jgi:hypothetical protein
VPAQAAQPVRTSPPANPSAARNAYEAALAAFERGDSDAYFGAFAPTLECFHGQTSVAANEVRRERERLVHENENADEYHRKFVHPIELRVASATEDQVELVDYGWTGQGAGDAHTVFHQKRVRMRLIDGAWRISVETPLDDARCGLPPVSSPPPYLWTRLRREHRSLVARCECSRDDCPGIGGSNGCDPSSFEPSARELCASAPAAERASCLSNAVHELRRFGFGAYGE